MGVQEFARRMLKDRDAKQWAGVRVDRGRVFQDQDDVTDRFDSLASLIGLVQGVLAEIGVAAGEVRAARPQLSSPKR